MISIAICDDEQSVVSYIELLLLELSKKHGIDITVEVYSKSSSLLRDIRKKTQYDLYYLDIEMPYVDGISLAEEIRIQDKHTKIIYVTSYENYAIESFKVQPFQFMRKPIAVDLFEQYFLQIVELYEEDEIYYHYAFNKIRYKKSVKEIQYFYSNRRTITIVDQAGEETKFIGKLNQVELEVQAYHQFLRIHQSYLVNYKYVSRITAEYVELLSGVRLSISGDRTAMISRMYTEYVRGELCQ